MSTPDHHIEATDANVHHAWDADRDPIRTVEPGEVVRFECLDATGGGLAPGATVEDVRSRESPGHAMTGPVAVEGVEPGDGLAVAHNLGRHDERMRHVKCLVGCD